MNIKESAKLIEAYLDMDRKPVGVKFFFTEEDYNKCNFIERDNKVTYCNAIQLASIGKILKVRKAHQACPNGATAMGFNPMPPKMASGEARLGKNIYADLETSKSVSDGMEFLEREPFGLGIAPLDSFDIEPDVVIVIGGSYNIMRLIQGYSFKNGYSPNIKTVGLQAVCHDLTTYPYNHDDINITFLCPGTRLVADWKQEELGIGMAWSNWYNIVEGVIETTNPFSRNGVKEGIVKRLDAAGLDSSKIEFNKNYDTGSYSGGKIEK